MHGLRSAFLEAVHASLGVWSVNHLAGAVLQANAPCMAFVDINHAAGLVMAVQGVCRPLSRHVIDMRHVVV